MGEASRMTCTEEGGKVSWVASHAKEARRHQHWRVEAVWHEHLAGNRAGQVIRQG
jgi:hypothetical protein